MPVAAGATATSVHICFLMAARLALSPEELVKVTAKMREMGADVEAINPVQTAD